MENLENIKIGGLQKLSLIDYPGKLSCTVFLINCPFRCPFCHNKDLVLPELTKNHFQISVEDFFSFLKERRGFLEGVTITGGEPTLYKELLEFCSKIKNLGFLIKLDTNGYNPEMVQNLIDLKLIDYVALDVKAPKEKYGKVIGINDNLFIQRIISNIEKSVEILKQGKIDYEFRTTIIPTLLDKNDILEIAKWIYNVAAGQKLPKYFLQNFVPKNTLSSDFEKINPYPIEYLIEIQKVLSPFFEACQIRK